MGDILFLAHRLPYPPDRGDRIRSWHVLKALATLAPVHVVAPLDDASDAQHLRMVESVAASVTTAVRPKSRGLAVGKSFLTGQAASVELFTVPKLVRNVQRIIASGGINTVYAFSGQMARYVPTLNGVRFVMDFVDMDSAKFAAQAQAARGATRMILSRESKRLQAFEAETAMRADVSLFVSRAEADLFEQATGIRADVLENGIDLDHFRSDAVAPVLADAPLIVFTGQMDYGPNIDAVTSFVCDVLPRLGAVTFAIVGRAPTAAVRALAGPMVTVTGEVPDTRPWLAAADVVVAPLKLARGVQNKILEAMAMGKAVVASASAAQGIDATDGREIIAADDPTDAIMALLRDPERRRALGLSARARMVARYGWDAQMTPLAGFVGR
jgi:polysaccharide biosynthesis protein PslH